MIGNITKGSDFKGLLDYLLAEEKQPKIINSQMIRQNASEIATEFNAIAAQRDDVELTVRHISLSFAPDDIVDDFNKALIVDRVMREMGYEDCQYIAIAHHPDDPGHDLVHEHEHLHIVANAVSVFGERVSDSWDRLKIQPILREIEKDFGLKQVVSSVDRWAQKAVEEKAQVEKAGTKLAQIIDLTAEQQPDLQTWLDRLDRQHVDVRFTLKRDGSVRGIAYLQSGMAVRGSEIERTWKVVEGKIATGPDDDRVMAAANIKSQQHRMNMSAVEQQRFEQAVMMSAIALEGRARLKTGRIHLKREDKTITAYRMRPHKQILKAVETDRGWEAIGQVKIDDKDLELLSKVSGIAQVAEIQAVQTDLVQPIGCRSIDKSESQIAPWEIVEAPQSCSPSRIELSNWFAALAHDRNITDDLQKVAHELREAYMAEDFMQGQSEPDTLPDDYRSLDVTISIEAKESMDSLVQEQMQLEQGYSHGR
jgi:Relaxase/Mobilisation nuclease domain